MNIKGYSLLLLALSLAMVSHSQVETVSIADIHQNIVPVRYDSSFIRPSEQTTPHEKAGLVGQTMTFGSAPEFSSIYWPDGEQFSSSTPTNYFVDKIFEIIEYKKGKAHDYFVVENLDGKWIFADNNVDWYLNGFVKKFTSRFTGTKYYNLHKDITVQGLDGKSFYLSGSKPLTITEISVQRINKGYTGMVVTFDNGLSTEVITQRNRLSGISLSGITISNGMYTHQLLSKEGLKEFTRDYSNYSSTIRAQKLRIGMTMEEVIMSWGKPTMDNIEEPGFTAVWEYGDATYSQRLFFQGDKLVHIL